MRPRVIDRRGRHSYAARPRVVALGLAALACVACKDKPSARKRDAGAGASPPTDASAPGDAGMWPELAKLLATPNVSIEAIEPVRVIALPAKLDAPRFTLGGPVLLGDLALVSSSQFGFTAVDFRRGQIAWNRPSGSHVAPPVVIDGNAVLIGSCVNPPTIPDDEVLLGCMRVVTPTGSDQAYIAIRGRSTSEFQASAGEQEVWASAQGVVTWRRGEAAVAIDLLSGVARAAAPQASQPLVVSYRDKTWEVRRTDDGYIEAKGKPPWKTESQYGNLIGAVYIPEQAPMIRVTRTGRHEGAPEILMFDIDATGSLHGQVSLNPAPGIGLIGHAISKVGNTALAIRLDTSLERDYVAGYSANAALQWVYPLPRMPRPDRVGLAIAHDAVVVFHDGDTVTVLPELSAPPTAPGAVRDPSEIATP